MQFLVAAVDGEIYRYVVDVVRPFGDFRIDTDLFDQMVDLDFSYEEILDITTNDICICGRICCGATSG